MHPASVAAVFLCLGCPPLPFPASPYLVHPSPPHAGSLFRKASGNVSWVKNPITCLTPHHQPQVSMTLKGQIFLLGVCTPELTKSWYKANAQPILLKGYVLKISQDPRGQISVHRAQGEKKTFLSLQLFNPEINSIQLQRAGTPCTHTLAPSPPSPVPWAFKWPFATLLSNKGILSDSCDKLRNQSSNLQDPCIHLISGF